MLRGAYQRRQQLAVATALAARLRQVEPPHSTLASALAALRGLGGGGSRRGLPFLHSQESKAGIAGLLGQRDSSAELRGVWLSYEASRPWRARPWLEKPPPPADDGVAAAAARGVEGEAVHID
eukprot:COSAG01_NODE_1930_length_8875_cov_10.550365_2_plen_123_part_00